MLNIMQFKKIAIKIYSTQKKKKINKCRAYLTLLMLLLLPLSLKLSCHDHLTVDIMPLHRNKIGQIINEFHVLQIADWEGIIIPKEKNPYLLVVVLILWQINLPKKKEIYSGYRAIMHCTNIQSLTLISEDQLKFILILVLINFLF